MMLLTCCFRNPHECTQKKDEVKNGRYWAKIEVKTFFFFSFRIINCFLQEKYPPKREEKRLLKQKSQESLQKRSLTLHNLPGRDSLPFIDQIPVVSINVPIFATISAIHARKQLYGIQEDTTKYSPGTRRVSTFIGSFRN